MTLRGRTFLSVGAVLALLFAALYAGTSALLADAYSRTEQVLLAESLDRALGALDANLGSLMETARDWDHRRAAPGDQTGTESRDPESESSVRHYETLDVDFMLRVTPSDAVSFADGPKGDLARGATDLRRALPGATTWHRGLDAGRDGIRLEALGCTNATFDFFVRHGTAGKGDGV